MNDVPGRREKAIERYGVLLEEPGEDLTALVALAAQVCASSRAAVCLVSGGHAHEVVRVGGEPWVGLCEDSLCATLLDEPGPVVVPDLLDDERFACSATATSQRGTSRFYGSAPLRTGAGVAFGRLCVYDDFPRHIDEEQTRALCLLADRMVDLLELRVRTRELEASVGELGRARDELGRSNRRLSQFAAQVSHDLRTPLTAIMLNTEVVAEEPLVSEDAFASKHLNAALEAGRRMTLLMDEFLESAQVGAAMRLAPVELGAVANAVARDVEPLLGVGDEVIVEALPSVIGDEQQLYSVLLNLVSNAVKYARPGVPAEVVIGAARGETGWRISVEDNGVGVAEARTARLFEPFVRGVTDVPGNGVGLATAKRIVDAHGGQIGLAPAPSGTGALAWFEIPD